MRALGSLRESTAVNLGTPSLKRAKSLRDEIGTRQDPTPLQFLIQSPEVS